MFGEDPDDLEGNDKPIRLLTNFYIFHRKNGEHAVARDIAELDTDNPPLTFQALGEAATVYEEEEAGQDDDALNGSDGAEGELQKLRTSPIIGYNINYAEADRCVSLAKP